MSSSRVTGVVSVAALVWGACATTPPPMAPAVAMRAQIARGELYEACVAASDPEHGDWDVLQELRAVVTGQSDITVGALAFDGPALLRGPPPRRPSESMAIRAEEMPGTTGFFLALSVRQTRGPTTLAPGGRPGLLAGTEPMKEPPAREALVVSGVEEDELTRQKVAKLAGVAATDEPAFSGWDFLGILATGGLLLADDKYRAGLSSAYAKRREPTTEAEWRKVDQIGGWWMQRLVALADGYEQRVAVAPDPYFRVYALRLDIELSLARDAQRCRVGSVRLELPLAPRGVTVAGAINAWFPHGPRPLRELQAEAATVVRDRCFFSEDCRWKGLCTAAPDGTCVAASDADCRNSRTCFLSAECWQAGGACAKSSAKRCAGSRSCRLYGFCASLVGPFDREESCLVVSPRACRESERCSEHGLCVPDASGLECNVGTPTQCRASTGCRLHGECTPGEDRCEPARDEDCRASNDCRELGWCSHVDGHCVAARDEDCADSRMCRELGWCQASYDGCYGAPPAPRRVEAWLAH